MDCGVMSDARMFDVAKGVLIGARGYGLDEALAELVSVAEHHRIGALALARALVSLAAPDVEHESDDAAVNAAASTWGQLFVYR